MTSIKPRVRPYTNPMIKNPTYPTVIGNQIREMPWQEELRIYSLVWIDGHEIDLVRATSPEEAIKKARPPWGRYPADIKAVLEE